MKVLELHDLEKKLKGFHLGPISLSLDKGTLLGLVGSSGSGKTTLLRTLMGMVHQDSGDISVNGEITNWRDGKWKQQIGYVGDFTALFELWSGRKNLKHFGMFYDKWSVDRTETLAKQLKLDLDTEVEHYSTGQRTKLSLVFALARQPDLLILDEPDRGLSPMTRKLVFDILLNMNRRFQTSIIYATQNISDILSLVEEFAFLENGKITRKVLKKDIANNWTRVTFHLESEIADMPAMVRLEKSGHEYEVLSDDKAKTLRFLSAIGAKSVSSNALLLEQTASELLEPAVEI